MEVQALIKLQESHDEYNGKIRRRFRVEIPAQFIEEHHWNKGQTLEWHKGRNGNDLVLQSIAVPKHHDATYEEFEEKTVKALTTNQNGLFWTEIQKIADIRNDKGLPMKTPPNLWVERLEQRKDLERVRQPKSNKLLWKLTIIERGNEIVDKSKINSYG
jgi:hypothetical protein